MIVTTKMVDLDFLKRSPGQSVYLLSRGDDGHVYVAIFIDGELTEKTDPRALKVLMGL